MIDEKALSSAMEAYSPQTQGQPDRGRLARAIAAYLESAKPKEAEVWRDIASAPKDGTPVLVHLSAKDIAKRDGWHGPAQVAANRGRGWISIPGMWSCTPVAWRPIPRAMLSAAGDGNG